MAWAVWAWAGGATDACGRAAASKRRGGRGQTAARQGGARGRGVAPRRDLEQLEREAERVGQHVVLNELVHLEEGALLREQREQQRAEISVGREAVLQLRVQILRHRRGEVAAAAAPLVGGHWQSVYHRTEDCADNVSARRTRTRRTLPGARARRAV